MHFNGTTFHHHRLLSISYTLLPLSLFVAGFMCHGDTGKYLNNFCLFIYTEAARFLLFDYHENSLFSNNKLVRVEHWLGCISNILFTRAVVQNVNLTKMKRKNEEPNRFLFVFAPFSYFCPMKINEFFLFSSLCSWRHILV